MLTSLIVSRYYICVFLDIDKMAERFYRSKIVQAALRERREKRFAFMLSKVNLRAQMSILDVGCGPDGRSVEDYISDNFYITGIDLYEECKVSVNHPHFTYIQQDASDLSRFEDNKFDLAFCVGMMEHICDRRVLLKIVQEIERVSKQYVIVVPWKWAWIEPHFHLFFFQLLPEKLKLFLIRAFNLHNLGKRIKKDRSYLRNHYQWLSSKEWKAMFVDSKVYVCPGWDTIAVVKRIDIK